MKKRYGFLLVLILCRAVYALDIPGFIPDKTVIYKEINGTALKLDIFNPPGLKAGDKRPAVIFFYGGGWFDGNPSQFHAQCSWLASCGMVACSADYRVKARQGTTPYEAVKDAKSAMRWLRTHAVEMGVDSSRIAAAGGSAGGHLAAILGDDPDCDESSDDRSVSARPTALILFNPPIDLSSDRYVDKRSGAEVEWLGISPLQTMTADTPPSVLFHGLSDTAVPVKESEDYKKQADEKGVRCDLHLYPARNHGFFNYVGNKQDFKSTMLEVNLFLKSLGWIDDSSAPAVLPHEKIATMDVVRAVPHSLDELVDEWKCDTGSKWKLSKDRWSTPSSSASPKPVLYNTKVKTENGFKLSATVMLKSSHPTAFAGLVCNYQNATDQYIFRFNGEGLVQFLRKNSTDSIFNKKAGLSVSPDTAYRLTVLSEELYSFALTIENAETGDTLFSQNVRDLKELYSGGFGGFYSTVGSASFGDYTLRPVEGSEAGD